MHWMKVDESGLKWMKVDKQEGEFQQYCESCKKKLYNWRVKTAVDGWMDAHYSILHNSIHLQ